MDRQTKRETNSPRGRRVASPAGPAGASLSPAATPVPAPSGRRRPEAPCFFPYVPPLLPNADRESPAALAGDAEQLQDLRLRSVAQNCRALASILRLEDWDEIAEALHADGEEGALSFGEFLAQYLATMGSISENCAWEAEDEISSASRWRTGARHNSATLLDPLMDLGQDEASPAQVARATLEAIADSPEDRHLARFLWEVIHRIVEEPVDGLGGRIAIASLFSVKAVIDMVQIYGPSNPTPCRLIVAKLVERDVTGQLAADFRHLGSILHDSLAKTIRKLGKATVPDLPPKSRSLAGETELDPQEQRLLSLLQLVLSISRTIGAVARFLPRDLASNTLGSTSDLLEEFSQSYDILSALLEQASAISLRYRNGHGAAVGNDIPGDEASSLPSFDMSEIPPPLEESLDDRQLAVHVTGPNDSAERIYSAISSTKAALLAGIHVVLYEFYYEAAVAASESDSELAASIASELVSVIWTLVSNTPPKDVALYAVNAPLVLDLEIRFNLSDVIRAAVIQAGASSDADAASSEYVIKWLNDAVTTSGNAAEKWRYGTSRSHMLGDDQFDRLSVSGGPPTPDPRGGRDDGGRGRSPEGRLDQYAGDVAVHFSEDYIKRTSLIAQIKDLFPELGEGFIEACLIVFEDDAERVIMSVLEDSLPSSLQKLDRLMPRAPQASPGLRQVSPPEQPPAYDDLPPPSVLQERRNVFDGDEFDILSARGNVDVGDSIRLGKKRQPTADEVLDDKRFVQDMRSAILDAQYESEEEEAAGQPKYDMYDDELDDSYDVIGPRTTASMPRPGIPDESEDDTELSSEDEEAQQDPEAARESLLVAAAITDPSVFSVEQKKSQKAQALSRSTGWSHEQLVGWYRMFQNNPNKQRIVDAFELRRRQNRPVETQGAGEAGTQQPTGARSRKDYARKTQNKGKARQGARDRKMAKGMF